LRAVSLRETALYFISHSSYYIPIRDCFGYQPKAVPAGNSNLTKEDKSQVEPRPKIALANT